MTLSSKLIKFVFGPSFHGCWGPLERPLAILGRSWRSQRWPLGGPTALLDSGNLWEGLWPRLGPNLGPKIVHFGVPFWA